MKKLFCILSIFLLLLCSSCAGTDAETPDRADFIFLSDTQALPADSYTASDYADYARLLSCAREQEPDASLLLLGGDTVNDGSDEAEWSAWFEAGDGLLEGLTVLAAEGNHDRRALVYDMFPRPAGADHHRGSFWSWDCGSVHFLVLDSSLMGAAEAEDIAWVEQDLAACEDGLIVVLMHHPAYPALDIERDCTRAETIREQFVPLFERCGVDLVLCGHQHVYMRTAPQNGVTYVMLASGPKEYVGASRPDYAEVLLEEPACLTGRVDDGKLEIMVYGENGILDNFVIE